MSLREWQGKVVDWADRKGWWDTERNVPEIIALIHSEVTEGYEALESAADFDECLLVMSEKIPEMPLLVEEMADIIIRIMDWAGHQDISVYYFDDIGISVLVSEKEYDSVIKHFLSMHKDLSKALEVLRKKGAVDTSLIGQHLQNVVIEAKYLTVLAGWDIEKAIEMKMAVNEKRPYRHGKAL